MTLPKRQSGASDPHITRLTAGAFAMGDPDSTYDWALQDDADSIAITWQAIDVGITGSEQPPCVASGTRSGSAVRWDESSTTKDISISASTRLRSWKGKRSDGGDHRRISGTGDE